MISVTQALIDKGHMGPLGGGYKRSGLFILLLLGRKEKRGRVKT